MNLKHLGFSDFLEEDEKVSAVFRHPLGGTFIKMIFFAGIWASIAWLVWFYWADYYYDYSSDNQYNLLWLIPAIIGAVKVFDIFMKWYANAILMTSESLVFSEFRHIFDRSASRIDYFDLDDVELEKKGVGDYLGNKGDLIFAKVSGGTKEFKRIGSPRKIIRRIRKHKAKILDEKNFTEEGALKDLLSQLVQTHVRGKGQPHEERTFHKEKLVEDSSEKISRDSKEIKNLTEVLVTKELLDSFSETDFIRMKEEELAKLRAKEINGDFEIEEEYEMENVDENPAHSTNSGQAKFSKNPPRPLSQGGMLINFAKKIKERHFHNDLDDNEYSENIKIEKELDDEGGLEIEL